MNIRTKLLIIVAVLIVMASGITTIISKISEQKLLKQQIYNRLDITAQSRVHHIETFLEISKETIKQLSESIVIEQFLVTDKNDPAYKKKFHDALRRLKYTEDILDYTYDILVINKDGIVVATSHKEEIGKDKSSNPYFIGGKKGPYIKEAYFSENIQRKCIAFSTPILIEDNSVFLGVVVQRISLEKINQIVQDKTGLGESGEMYLINKDYYMITPSLFKENTFLRQKIDTPESREWKELSVQEEIIERKEVDVYTTYHGETVLGTHYRIKRMDWLLMAEISEKEAFAPLDPIHQFISLLFIILLFLGLALFLMVSRTIIKPITDLQKGAEELKNGNLTFRLHLKTKDEFAQLAGTFNEMAASLLESQLELQGYSLGLEVEVAEKDLELKGKSAQDERRQTTGINIEEDMKETGRDSQTQITEEKMKDTEILKKDIELNKINKIAVSRELKIIELKKELNAMLIKAGKNPRYKIVGEDSLPNRKDSKV